MWSLVPATATDKRNCKREEGTGSRRAQQGGSGILPLIRVGVLYLQGAAGSRFHDCRGLNRQALKRSDFAVALAPEAVWFEIPARRGY